MKKSEYRTVFVTIIMPVRNEAGKIRACLDSIINQNYPKDLYEILVVDGMSTDGTRDIIKSYCEKCENMYLFDNKQKIVPTALNIGLEKAKGELIIRVDGHCRVEKDFIRLNVEYSRKTGAECVGGRLVSINGTFVGKAIALGMSSRFGVGNAAFRYAKKEGYADTVAFGAYRREVFAKIGTFDDEFIRCQDDEFNYRLRKAGGKIFLTPVINVHYFPRASLHKLVKQYFQYGFWKVRVFQKHPGMMQMRQFVPAGFVSAMGIVALLSLRFQAWTLVLAFIFGLYFIAMFVTTLMLAIRSNWKNIFVLPLVFPCLHFSYGLGFLIGMIRFALRWQL